MDKDTTHLIIKAVAAIVCAAIIAFGLKGPRYQFQAPAGTWPRLFDTWTGKIYGLPDDDDKWKLWGEFK